MGIQGQEDERFVGVFLCAADPRRCVQEAVGPVVVLGGEDEGCEPSVGLG
jgi:hypothetical protein